jgi:hypothetical protein
MKYFALPIVTAITFCEKNSALPQISAPLDAS